MANPVNLQKGFRGQPVTSLHKQMNKLGLVIHPKEYKSGTFGPDTSAKISTIQRKFGIKPTGKLDDATAAAIRNAVAAGDVVQDAVIKGKVSDENSKPAVGYKVEIFKATFSALTSLGVATTAADGAYQVTYKPAGERVDIVIVVTNPAGVPYETPTIFAVSLELEQNVVYGGGKYLGRSEFESWVDILQNKIGKDKAIASLGTGQDPAAFEKDILFLSGASSITTQKLLFLIIAHKIEATKKVPAKVIFGFLRQKQPGDMPADLLAESKIAGLQAVTDFIYFRILSISPEMQQKTLRAAVDINSFPVSRVIPPNTKLTVDAVIDAQIADFVKQLQDLETAEALNIPFIVGKTPLKTLLDIAKLPAAKQQPLAGLLTKHDAALSLFWDKEEVKKMLTPEEIKSVRTTLEIGSLVKNHPPVLTAIKAQLDADPKMEIADFAKFLLKDWVALITKVHQPPASPGFPDNIKDGQMTDAEAINIYATIIDSNFDSAYLTAGIAKKLATEADFNIPNREDTAKFLVANPDFDLKKTNIDNYLTDPANKEKLNGLDPAVLRIPLKQLQRVLRLTDNKDTLKILLHDNIHSAKQIYRMGRTVFMDRYVIKGTEGEDTTGKLTGTEAARVFEISEKSYAGSVALFSQLNYAFNVVNPAAVGNFMDAAKDQLKDKLVNFPNLEKLFGSNDFCECEHCRSVYSPAAYMVDLLQFLKERNTTDNKPVRDVLLARRPDIAKLKLNCDNTNTPLPYIDVVNEILESAVAGVAGGFQTVGTQEELRANPANVIPAAYDKLANPLTATGIPFGLPFHLWEEEGRAYLDHLQISRAALIETFKPVNNPLNEDAWKKQMAAAWFGWPGMSADLVVNDAAITPVVDALTLQKKIWGTATLTDMNNVRAFLDRTGLSYEEMLALLNMRTVNAGQLITIDDGGTCNTQIHTIKTIAKNATDVATLSIINKVLRLVKKLGWAMWEVDKVIQCGKIGAGVLNIAFLHNLRLFDVLKKRLALPVDQLVAFYENVDFSSQDALYQRLFLNKAVLNPVNANFEVVKVTAAPVVAKIDDPAVDNRSVILAGLNITEADLFSILALLNIPPAATPIYELSLANLSHLYRYSTLAAALNISVKELLVFTSLQGVVKPFDSPDSTLQFIQQFETLQATGITIPEAQTLLKYYPASPLAPADSVITDLINGYRTSIRIIKTEAQLAGTAPADVKLKVENQITQSISDWFTIEVPVLKKVLSGLKLSGANKLLLDILNDDRLTAPLPADPKKFQFETNKTNFADVYKTLYLLYKIGFLISKLRLNVREMEWLLANAATFNLMPLSDLPVADGQTTGIDKLFNISTIIGYNKLFAQQDQLDFLQVLSGATANPLDVPAWLDGLALLTGWDKAAITKLNTLLKFVNADFIKPAYYQTLYKVFSWVRIAGVGPDKLAEWSKAQDLRKEDAQAIKLAVKAKYSNAQWLTITQPIQDVLREQKRDALCAYMLANLVTPANNWKTKDDLYAWYLVDVEMSSCQLTSRMVQANGSIQLFVQRGFMNLEANNKVIIDSEKDPQWNQWKWMKNYRIWEANRKVFLYPENWIEPELRDNKTPFFQELENDLQQNEITNESVETAFMNYLEKLEAVSRLDICGMFEQQKGPQSIMYVVGRTKGIPHNYYMRKFLNGDRWTAWEKIDADITGEHIMPVMFNNKLHVFWPVFMGEPKPNMTIPPAAAGALPAAQPDKFWKIQIAWTVFKNGKWQPKKISKEILPTIHYRPDYSYHLKTTNYDNAGELRLHLYYSVSPEFDNQSPIGKQLRHISEFVFNGLTFELFKTDTANTDIYGELGRQVQTLPIDFKQPDFILPTGVHHKYNDLVNDAYGKQPVVAKIADGNRLDDGVVFKTSRTPFSLVIRHQDSQFDSLHPFVFKDRKRSFFIRPTVYYKNGSQFTVTRPVSSTAVQYRVGYECFAFYHPMVELFMQKLAGLGVDGILNRATQLANTGFDFKTEYGASSLVTGLYPRETVDFNMSGPYAIYNWELFFHIPYFIANKLSQNQRFDEAYRWYNYIFNPAGTYHTDPVTHAEIPTPQRYWITRPFYETTSAQYYQQQIENLMLQISKTNSELEKQIDEWRDNPFNPHLLAQYRTVAYQKNIVMKFIDNLLSWADNLFSQDSMESVNEATQLYVMAAVLLGPRPKIIPSKAPLFEETYESLEPNLDEFSNALVETENFVPVNKTGAVVDSQRVNLPDVDTLYFCIPHNDKLLDYWDKVGDRLYKIRHCLNIEGVFRQLALFQPPIDPALLVKAAAAGIDLGSVMEDAGVNAPIYRFNIILSKAQELCNDVKALGGALLSVLEKKDAEGLALLRATQEIKVLEANQYIRKQQISEVKEQIEGLNRSKITIEARRDYFASRSKVLPQEQLNIDKLNEAQTFQEAAQGVQLAASLIALIPDIDLGVSGFGGSPLAKFKFGGLNLAQAAKASSDVLSFLSLMSQHSSNMAGIKAGHERRWEEWQHQIDMANKELNQIESQITAAEIRLNIATRELDNLGLQISNAHATDEYMRGKYTNQQLYDWMITQISATYFQSYKMAYEVAKKAEKAYRFELGLQDSDFISFGYWDSLKKGLLSGEKLHYDLKRLDIAYLDQNKRQYELTKHISLANLAPQKLADLKNKGTCEIPLAEMLFDLDYPGHYMRRIKSVSISIPCVTGPYTSINATLTLLTNSFRTKTDLQPASLVQDFAAIQSIATSGAQNDSGLFELNFRDERFLPFEGAGAISTWRLDMPKECNQFDFNTIADVIIHLKYQSREGGSAFKQTVMQQVVTKLPKEGYLLLDAKHEYASAWYKFLHPENNADQQLDIALTKDRFPFFTRSLNVKISNITCYGYMDNMDEYKIQVKPLFGDADTDLLTAARVAGEQWHIADKALPAPAVLAPLQIKIRKTASATYKLLTEDEIKEMLIVIKYQVNS